MAGGTWINSAFFDPSTRVITRVDAGPVQVRQLIDFPPRDPLALSVGDSFLVSTLTGSFTYTGATADGGFTGISLSQGSIYISDSPLRLFDTVPPADTSGVTPICFATGTLIATPDGEKPVERLSIGDPVFTADGATVPVKWLGRQRLQKLFSNPERIAPVRITAGALGNGLPHTDLLLTACHAVIVDGLAITAGALVNGTTILRDPVEALPDTITYWHVETEGHRVILANGSPAETFLDHENRRVFDNYAEYVELYGEQPGIEEMPMLRITAARQVPAAIRRRLEALVPA